MSAPKTPKALAKARERGLAEALAQERLALAAITKVMLLEVDDPRRVLARIDAMARAAEGNRRVPTGTRRALIDGARLVRRALERERSQNQGTQTTMLDPPKPEPKPERIDDLVNATDGPEQLGLVGHEAQIGGDVEEAHTERVATISRIHEALVELLHPGPATDQQLYERYLRAAMTSPLPQQTATAIKERRRELSVAGRIVPTEDGWQLIERAHAEAKS